MACDHENGEYISPIFTSPKNDGTHRMTLNPKSLHKIITHHYLKMDTIWHTVCLMKPGCYTYVGLKDAYYSVPIHPFYKNIYRIFCWKGQLYKCFS